MPLQLGCKETIAGDNAAITLLISVDVSSKWSPKAYLCFKATSRVSSVDASNVEVAVTGQLGEVQARCQGRFNLKKDRINNYRKPKRLLQELKTLFDIEPKLRPHEMKERMAAMIDPAADGGLYLCYSKRETNGMLLSEDTIIQWIGSETQKRKKSSKKGPTEIELEQALRIREFEVERGL